MSEPTDAPHPPRKNRLLPFVILVIVFGTGLFMLNRDSLRRPLSDAELTAFLADSSSGRDAYHAAEEVSRRIQAKDASVKAFYPAVIAMAKAEDPEHRKAAAWVMGEDNKDETFRAALLPLLGDPVAIVARNAALSTARHGSAAGVEILRSMLKPTEILAPEAGVFTPKSHVGDTLDRGHQIGSLAKASGGTLIIEPPFVGKITKLAAANANLTKGDLIASLGAAQSHARDAIIALMFPGVGRAEHAADIEAFLAATPDLDKDVEAQAKEAITLLRARTR